MADDARRAFLAELIDDAGLFPPASLSMEDAVAEHRASRRGPFAWLLGRFICPASRLAELTKSLSDEPSPWRLSVILDGADDRDWIPTVEDDLAEVGAFAEETSPRAAVEFLEVRLPAGGDSDVVGAFAERLARDGPSAVPFLEVPPEATLPETLRLIARVRDEAPGRIRPGAKLRCGGASADLFPTPARVASFVDACRRLGVPFKATAGLHHPFRHEDPATGLVHHGFVNLIGAAVLAHGHGLDADTIEEVVADPEPSSFAIAPESFSWKGLHASPAAVAAARSGLVIGYGSCSFAEPVDDLASLGALPA